MFDSRFRQQSWSTASRRLPIQNTWWFFTFEGRQPCHATIQWIVAGMLLSSSDQGWNNQKETKPKRRRVHLNTKRVNKHFDHFFLMLTLKPTQLKLPPSPNIQKVVSSPVDANHHHHSRPTSAWRLPGVFVRYHR